MFTAVVVIHILVCLMLIFIILIQSSKGAQMGAAFGGSNQTLFGGRGAATFLNKLTTIAAILFMLTSLSLAIFTVKKGSIMSSVSVKESPLKPLADTSAGPLEQPVAAPGQGDAQDSTAPAEPDKK